MSCFVTRPLMPVPGFSGARSYSEHTSKTIDDAMKEIVAGAFSRALASLTRNRKTLEHAAELLLERETLTEIELHGLAGQLAKDPSDPGRFAEEEING